MIAMITGATSGFGDAIARRFVAEGHRVIVTGRRSQRLDALRAALGEAVFPLAFDVGDRAAVERAFASLPASFASIDVLVNNAGGAIGIEPAQLAKLDEWDAMIDANVKGLVYCTHAALPGMIERKRGHVVNIGSVAAVYPYPGGNVYGGAKAFVRQFSLNLRADLLGTPVRVTVIAPGMVGGTEFSNVRFRGDDARAAAVYEGVEPLTADDVAESVLWVVGRPPHVNINEIELMPIAQAFSPFAVKRGMEPTAR